MEEGPKKKKKTHLARWMQVRGAEEPVWRWASSSCGDKAAHGEPCENAKQAVWRSGAEGGRQACVWERQPRSICQQTVTKGAWRGLFSPDAIHRQFVRGRLLEPGPKAGEQLEASPVIDRRGLRELHLDVNEDKSATRLGECFISPSLSGDGGPWLRPSAGGYTEPRGGQAPPAN